MRLYSFVNSYLSPIQHGIQTAHCVGDMSTTYLNRSSEHKVYEDWAKMHKTIIVLNGGNCAMLRSAISIISDAGNKLHLPWVTFNEDVDSLDGSLTSVAIIVPKHIYDVAEAYDKHDALSYVHSGEHKTAQYDSSSPEFPLIQLLKSKKLA